VASRYALRPAATSSPASEREKRHRDSDILSQVDRLRLGANAVKYCKIGDFGDVDAADDGAGLQCRWQRLSFSRPY